MKTIENGELKYSVNAGIATIEINRPNTLNSLDIPIVEDMRALLDQIDQDENIRVVIMKSACTNGSVYTGDMAGADLAEMAALDTNFDFRRYYTVFAGFFARVRTLSQPVITVLNGYAYGGATALAQSSEFVIVSEKTTFGMLEINFGFPGGAATFSQQFGRQKAAEITMLGRVFSAEEAYRMLLVYKVVPEEQLEAEVAAVCKKLCKQSFESLKMGKKLINISADFGVSAAVNYEVEAASLCLNTAYSKEKISSFLKKS